MPIVPLHTALKMLYSSGSSGGGGGNSSSSSGGGGGTDARTDLDYHSSWLEYTDVPNSGYAKQLQVIIV